jgi:uncharacterized membrane protein YsdA (DUF1294 family)
LIGGEWMLSLKIFLVVYVSWNAYVFIAMGRDKRRAKLHQWRIPEVSLLIMGALLGGIGLYAGMKVFHHKTSHSKFVIGVPILMLMNFLTIGILWSYLP